MSEWVFESISTVYWMLPKLPKDFFLQEPIKVLQRPILLLQCQFRRLQGPIKVLQRPFNMLQCQLRGLQRHLGSLQRPLRVLQYYLRVLQSPLRSLQNHFDIKTKNQNRDQFSVLRVLTSFTAHKILCYLAFYSILFSITLWFDYASTSSAWQQ